MSNYNRYREEEKVETNEEKVDTKYNELSKDNGIEMLKSNFGFIWFNDNLDSVQNQSVIPYPCIISLNHQYYRS